MGYNKKRGLKRIELGEMRIDCPYWIVKTPECLSGLCVPCHIHVPMLWILSSCRTALKKQRRDERRGKQGGIRIRRNENAFARVVARSTMAIYS
jgi:hypothetical protein